MRLYKITAVISNSTDGNGPARHLVEYVGSQTDAAAARKEFLRLGATRKEIETEEVDVPTDKAGLMAFLNEM